MVAMMKTDPAAIGGAGARKAESSRNPQTIDARPMTAVLEPQAVNDLVPLLSGSLNARAADEGEALYVLVRPRRLADDHHRRIERAVAHGGVPGACLQRAPVEPLDGRAQVSQR